jgi:hypothetical protein
MSLGQLLQRTAQVRQPQHHVIELQFRQTPDEQRDRRQKRQISPIEWCLIRSVAGDLVAQAEALVEQAGVVRKSIVELSHKVEERRQISSTCGCGGLDEPGQNCDCQGSGEHELSEFCCAMLLASVHSGRLIAFARLACPSLMDDRQRFADVIGAPSGMRAEAYAAGLAAAAASEPAAAARRSDPSAAPFDAFVDALMRHAQGDHYETPQAAPPDTPEEEPGKPDTERPSGDRSRGKGQK